MLNKMLLKLDLDVDEALRGGLVLERDELVLLLGGSGMLVFIYQCSISFDVLVFCSMIT